MPAAERALCIAAAEGTAGIILEVGRRFGLSS